MSGLVFTDCFLSTILFLTEIHIEYFINVGVLGNKLNSCGWSYNGNLHQKMEFWALEKIIYHFTLKIALYHSHYILHSSHIFFFNHIKLCLLLWLGFFKTMKPLFAILRDFSVRCRKITLKFLRFLE